jgi:hypothetical protein
MISSNVWAVLRDIKKIYGFKFMLIGDFAYSIYEYKYFDKKLLYTAMSRNTNKRNINFIDIYFKSEVGYIYTITDNNNKVYIGSTNTPDQRWVEHCRTIDDSPLHRSIKELGIENFKFDVIDTVDYIDKETLLIRDEYNSIETGYNMKHSIDLQNLY